LSQCCCAHLQSLAAINLTRLQPQHQELQLPVVERAVQRRLRNLRRRKPKLTRSLRRKVKLLISLKLRKYLTSRFSRLLSWKGLLYWVSSLFSFKIKRYSNPLLRQGVYGSITYRGPRLTSIHQPACPIVRKRHYPALRLPYFCGFSAQRKKNSKIT
jgi:hypothetical protein